MGLGMGYQRKQRGQLQHPQCFQGLDSAQQMKNWFCIISKRSWTAMINALKSSLNSTSVDMNLGTCLVSSFFHILASFNQIIVLKLFECKSLFYVIVWLRNRMGYQRCRFLYYTLYIFIGFSQIAFTN